MNKKKTIILGSIIIGILVFALGLTYAAITFNETKGNSQLVLGDIWMHYSESDTSINITDMMPSENYTNDYFEFTIDGKNTYDKKDIWYEIVLSHGDYEGDDENRTIRIDDQLLKFKLVEVVDGSEVEIFENRTYSDLTNKRIHVDTISSKDNNYSKTYRLYMRLAEYTTICGGDEDGCDYYLNPDSEYASLDWDKLFASIKVNVSGDLEEKSIETPGSCFTYEFVKIVNPVMATQDASDETTELYKCIEYFEDHNRSFNEGENLENFCRGIGTWQGETLQEYIFRQGNEEYYIENNIVINSTEEIELTGYDDSCGADVVIPREIDGYSINIINNDLQDCTNSYADSIFRNKNVKNVIILDNITQICYSAFSNIGIENVEIPNSVTTIYDDAFSDNELKTLIFEENSNLTRIGYYAFSGNQLTSVNIPNSVTEIRGGAFSNNQLISLRFEEDSVLAILDRDVFENNQLTNVEIPDSVTTLGQSAFRNNHLTSVDIPSNITTIENGVFAENQLISVEIPNSVITISFNAFENNQITNVVFEENSNLIIIDFKAFSNNQIKNIDIPNSVTTIGSSAFSNNQLETVTIGSGIQYINYSAFYSTQTSNPNLESITFTSKTCEEIKNIVASSSSTSSEKYFPWLYNKSPYYLEGYKASIFGTDGECIY